MRIIIKDISDKKRAVATIENLNMEKPWDVEIKEYKKNRSKSQNALYWKWLTIIGNDLGYSKDELHIVFADKFLEPIEVIALGVKAKGHPSTSSLNVDEFSEYLKTIERFAISELGMRLPNRDDLYYESLGC